MKILSILLTLILTLLISSCGTMPGMSVLMAKKEAAKLRPEYKQFQNLCENKEITKINSKLHVDGYLSASTTGSTCNDRWGPLFEYGYKYHECTTKNIHDYSSILNGDFGVRS